ncbi:hypothetical protein DP113_06095 [Brasilonema octagenarum UFV-E1]|jgi:hypothetical protein|uniref:Uncharacterized protein n=2 Tax=Brasilonema TaxID=383614 RepID=A0A856MEZ8_9CYAN|nr:hypothetical protein [Brasilonema octagenarum UFV-OR1]QDL07536.1 hypothetical protein DP114_06140 [Brasilonema sennae CENA114]QDL13898.1 hypothetical protein DP113_06095 [Brasilonema octagenarum UFV-E1]
MERLNWSLHIVASIILSKFQSLKPELQSFFYCFYENRSKGASPVGQIFAQEWRLLTVFEQRFWAMLPWRTNSIESKI